ncbi:UNVERIFIED_CONTAM: hypothetical protein Scaly_2927100 [Sesamum calycinum]|uniref:Uncharacterized protein n=1 Tax=Sesamum calycinum TaxID=2727403 RepID=A0AAW2KV12_9LAMI
MNGAANPTASSTVYRGESSSIGGKAWPATQVDGGDVPEAVGGSSPQPTADEGDTPAESESGKNNDCVFRLSSEAHFSSRTYTSPPIPPSLPPPSNPAVKDRIGRLEEMMADMMVMMREMQASSSTTGPSQSTVSSTAPAQPPTDTYPPNNDEMGGVKSTELTHGDYHLEALEAWSQEESRISIFWCGVDELWRIPVLESCVNKRRKEEESINFKKMSKNPLILIMETNKSNGTNYNYWLRNLRIVPNFENQGLSWTSRFQWPGLRGPLPKNVSRSRNGLRTTTTFFGTNMAEGSSVQSHGVKMLSLVEKLEDLKVGVDNDTYIDVILQSLPPSYVPFIINYNMNGLEKSIHELSNMLV